MHLRNQTNVSVFPIVCSRIEIQEMLLEVTLKFSSQDLIFDADRYTGTLAHLEHSI